MLEIQTCNIPIRGLLRKVQLSAERRAYYYDTFNSDGTFTVSKGKGVKGKTPPKKFFTGDNRVISELKDKYAIAFVCGKKARVVHRDLYDKRHLWTKYVADHFTKRQLKIGKFYLVNMDKGKQVLANPKSAGEPKYETINYQKLYNGAYHPATRNKIVTAIKEWLLPYIEEIDSYLRVYINNTCKGHRIVIETSIVYPIGLDNWDVGNRAAIYHKCFQDLLATGIIGDKRVMNRIIEDDSVSIVAREVYTHINCEYGEEGIMFSIYPISKSVEMDMYGAYLTGSAHNIIH